MLPATVTPPSSLGVRWADALDRLDLAVVQQLVQKDPDALLRSETDGNPLIQLLRQLGPKDRRSPILRALLKGVPEKGLYGRPEPLCLAANANWLEAVEQLLPLCDPNALYEGHTPLMRALVMGRTKVMEALIRASDPGVAGSDGHANGMTALMIGARKGFVGRIRNVLAADGRLPTLIVDQANDQGVTALMYACWDDRWIDQHALLELGADPNRQDHVGWTAVMYALRRGRVDVLQEFVNHHHRQRAQGRPGLNLLLRTQNGQTIDDLFAEHGPRYIEGNLRSARTVGKVLCRMRLEQERATLNNALDVSSPMPAHARRTRL